MKKYIILVSILFVGCTAKKVSIRKIPCDNIFKYNNAGTLNGTYLTLYYAVDYSDTIPFGAIRMAVDTIGKRVEMEKYAGFVCWFLKESSKLKEIHDCDITDSHNVSSDEHQAVAIFMYDAHNGAIKEIKYDKNGRYTEQPFRP